MDSMFEGLCLVVVDDGFGIVVVEWLLVFECFWCGSGYDVVGSGLGLVIVVWVVEWLGVMVSVCDGLVCFGGCGVCFELWL